MTYFDTEHFKTKFACELKNFDVSDFFDRKEARKMDRFAQYAMVASDEAIIDAKLDLDAQTNLESALFGVLELAELKPSKTK